MEKFNGSKSRVLISTAFLLAVLSILNSCSKSTDYNTPSPGPGTKGGPGTNEVWIQGMAFSPATITITAGTTIKWTNKDGVEHTVTSDTGLFDSGSMATGGTYSQQFNTPGTFPYHCAVHPGMKATVVVK
ncbi:MAG: plastocyanin/azurin family copper-binding protein [Methanococcaceae archaeon]